MNDLDKLLDDKYITLEQYRSYIIFALNDTGRSWLKEKKRETFLATATDLNSLGILAALEGARNVIRKIDFDIATIEDLIKNNPGDKNE